MENFSSEEVFNKLGINYERRGHKFVCLCPFHDEKTPSFHFDSEKQVGYCFGCGKGVNLWSLVKELTGQSLIKFLGIKNYSSTNIAYHNSLSRVQKNPCKTNGNKSEDSNVPEYSIIAKKENPYSFTIAKQYCEDRNITPQDIEKYGMFYVTDGYLGDTYFVKRLVIPIKNKEGIVVGFEGRDVTRTDPKKCIYNFRSKVGSTVFDLENLDKDKPVVWVEGILDKLQVEKALVEEDIQVSTFFGIQLTNIQKEIVGDFKNSTIMFDSDQGGDRGINNFEEVSKSNFYIAELEYGDPSENTLEAIRKAYYDRLISGEYFLKKYDLLNPKQTLGNFEDTINFFSVKK